MMTWKSGVFKIATLFFATLHKTDLTLLVNLFFIHFSITLVLSICKGGAKLITTTGAVGFIASIYYVTLSREPMSTKLL